MKTIHYAVEHICYQTRPDSYPSLDLDASTFERQCFLTREEAMKFIERFLADDPAFNELWVAKITLHILTDEIEMFFP